MTRCQFNSIEGHDAVYLEQYYCDKIFIEQYNSILGKFTGNTEKAKKIADNYNKRMRDEKICIYWNNLYILHNVHFAFCRSGVGANRLRYLTFNSCPVSLSETFNLSASIINMSHWF